MVGQSNSKTYAARWNGTSWSVVATPNRSGATVSQLNSVVCVSVSDCTAVGSDRDHGVQHMLIEHWDGTAWSLAALPAALSLSDSFASVSCTTPSSCTAVGASGVAKDHPLVARWDGTSWTAAWGAVPTGAPNADLSGVSCVAAADCTAVGRWISPYGNRTMAEHWDGTSWSVVTTPNRPLAFHDRLLSVSCAGSSSCAAVGTANVVPFDQTLALRYG
jgi:hypothetical protein